MAASFLVVFIDGKKLTEFSEEAILEQVEVRQELNEHWWCDVACRQTEDRRFPIEEALGKSLHVAAVDEDGVPHVLFDGLVLEGELEYEIFGSYTARLKGVTKSYTLDVTPRQACYRKKTLQEVADQMVGAVGLKAELQYKPIDPPLTYFQWGETDFSFLKRLADDHECWMRPTKDGLQIFDKFQPGSTMQWRGEEGLRNFKLWGKLGQPSMNGAHYDYYPMESKVFTEVKREPEFLDGAGPMVDAVKAASQKELPPGYVPQRSRVFDLSDYENLLRKESERAIGSKIQGHGICRNEDLLPGNTVKIDGVLDAAGTYGITKVIHRWDLNGYMNEFWCTPWKKYSNPEQPKVKAWHGLVSARVVANNDPDGIGRVKVKFPWQEDNDTFWVRVLTPHAGSDRGFYFMPEVGDEVVVAFGDGDPEKPAVIGCLWNGVDRAPTEEFWGGEHQKDDVKRIVTKSGHRIQIVDKEGKESIVLATPNFLKVSLIEKTDETGRSMITVHSENGDLFFSAPSGRIHFRSKYFSREVGVAGAPKAAGGAGAAAGGGGAKPTPKPKEKKADPVIEEKYNDGIVIKGPKSFVEKTKKHLDNIAKTPTGKKMLESLAKSGKKVTIVPTSNGNAAPPKNWKGALGKGKELKWKDDAGKEHSITGDGTGSDSTVEYNPDKTSVGSGTEDWQKRPPEVGLAHELIHADDAAHGKMDPTEKDGVRNYERQAVGLPPYDEKDFTENKIRSEWDPKQPARPKY